MSDELVEGTILAQIKAIESWALKANEEAKKSPPKWDVILNNLRLVNHQGRRLQPFTGKRGIRSLPESNLRDQLNEKVSEIRAAAISVSKDIRLNIALAEAKEGKLKRKIPLIIPSKTLKILGELVAETIQARKMVEELAVIPFEEFAQNKSLAEDFFRGEGQFENYPLDVRRKLWNDFVSKGKSRNFYEMRDLNLSHIDLSGFVFGGQVNNCDFSGTDLRRVSFLEYIDHCSFTGAILDGVDFRKSTFVNLSLSEVSAIGVNFAGIGPYPNGEEKTLRLSGNFENANFQNSKLGFLFNGNTSFKNAEFRDAKIDILNKEIEGKWDFTDAQVSRAVFRAKYNIHNVTPKLREALRTAKGKATVGQLD